MGHRAIVTYYPLSVDMIDMFPICWDITSYEHNVNISGTCYRSQCMPSASEGRGQNVVMLMCTIANHEAKLILLGGLQFEVSTSA